MENSAILDQLLLPLADNFEAGNRSFRTFETSSPQEFEPLRECIAGLVAEGSVEDYLKAKAYRFTPVRVCEVSRPDQSFARAASINAHSSRASF